MLKDSSRRTRFAAVNNDAKAFKKTVCQYIREHIDLDNISLLNRQMLAERFDLTLQCINGYVNELQEKRTVFHKLAAKYPLSIKALSVNVQQAIGISYHTADNLSLNPNAYQSTGIIKATYNMRLDFKIHNEQGKTLTLYLQDIERGGKYRLTLFEKEGKYQAYEGGIDFSQGFLNGKLFEMQLGVNKKGYPVLFKAILI